MLYRLAADVIVLLHLAYIAFAVLGGFLVLRWWRLAWLHLPAAVWAAYVELYLRYCPLTPLENRLRALAGGRGYAGGFVEHYLLPLIYPAGLTREAQFVLGAGVVVVNVALYARWIRSRQESGRQKA